MHYYVDNTKTLATRRNMNDPKTKTKGNQVNNLQTKLHALKVKSLSSDCTICNFMTKMDKETRNSFIEVMCSTASQNSISEALISEGFKVSKTTVGSIRRKCFSDIQKSTCSGLIEARNGK